MIPPESKICRHCGGSGWLLSNIAKRYRTCRMCLGKGYIKEIKKQNENKTK